MKREERVQQILKVAKAKKLNMTTLVFVLAMTPDKGLAKLQTQIAETKKRKK